MIARGTVPAATVRVEVNAPEDALIENIEFDGELAA